MNPGTNIGIFRIVERIGEGGMGEVFRAEDTMLERDVALKTLRPEMAARPELVERFRVEAIALAKMHHRHIAAVYAFFREGERYHIAMQFVPGRTLEGTLQERGRLPWRTAVAITQDVLAALEHAHGLGVVHRDLKPANLMIDPEGRTVVMDFGIARVLARARQTRSGTLVGTLEYIAPEIVKGQPADARSDLYSLGIVLYEMITGRLPFEARTDYELMRAHTETAPERPSVRAAELGIELPAALEAAILRALAKRPDDRFASAQAFGQALAAVTAAAPRAVPAPYAGAGVGAAAKMAAAGAGLAAQGRGVAQALGSSGRGLVEALGSSGRALARGLELPQADGGSAAWRIWMRRNPGLAGAAAAGVLALALVVAAALQPGPAGGGSGPAPAGGLGGGLAGGQGTDTGGATSPIEPLVPAVQRTEPPATAAASAPATASDPPVAAASAAARPIDYQMPPTPRVNVNIERPADPVVAAKPVASAPVTASAKPSPPSQTSPPAPPPTSTGEPGWYVRR